MHMLALLLSLAVVEPPPAGLITVGDAPARTRSALADAVRAKAAAEEAAAAEHERAEQLQRDLDALEHEHRSSTAWAAIGGAVGGLLIGGLAVGLAIAYGGN